ncbi:NADPH-dependent F420 reductase [Streptomyces sp. NPDC057620]|uniref:NADPH-dependent F420 reductase n=1 Tax=Streptomyces sp. NPDC057620 TaxID=3346185 RepID=UPI0036C2B825
MRIGILGTGTLAAALGEGWIRAGHEVWIGGRSQDKADRLAERLGSVGRPGRPGRVGRPGRPGRPGQGAFAVTPREAVTGRDAVLLAVSWDGVADMLGRAGAADGVLAGTPLIDPTNAVAHGVGDLLTERGESMATRIAGLAPGAHVVKAFHLFPAGQWTSPAADDGRPRATVAMCGDDPAALRIVGELVRDVGGAPATLGSLERVRQLEEVAGFVIGLAFAGVDPNSAIPKVS